MHRKNVKFAGKFDHGWDKQREITHAKQLEMGVIPKGTKLTPRSEDVPAWDAQSAEAKKVYTRLMENYAAYMAYTDHEAPRLIDSLQESVNSTTHSSCTSSETTARVPKVGWKAPSARSPA